MQIGLRYIVTTPLAALMTAGLFIGMKALITGDFKAQKKIAATQFEINPTVEDIPIDDARVKLAEYEKVETPPPPPIINRESAQLPAEPIAKPLKNAPDFDPFTLDIKTVEFTPSDTDEQPILRVAANMPPRAERSGHCKVIFDVSPLGEPYNIQAPFCSDRIFERPTLKAVAKWKYRPKVQGGQAVTRRGVKNQMTFKLTDERGQIIPE